MKLKIAALLIVLSVFVPSVAFAEIVSTPTPHDYNNGLLDDNSIIESNDLPNEAYDNDLDTSFLLTSKVNTIHFKQPVHVKGMYYDGAQSNQVKILFDNGQETIIEGTSNAFYTEQNFQDVVSIEVYRSSGSSVTREIEFFGTYEKDSIISTPEPSDYMHGLLDIESNIKETNFPSEIYDNDLDTKYRFNSPDDLHYVEFKSPVNITGMYLKYVRFSSQTYFYADDELIFQLVNSSDERDGYSSLNLEGITRIEFNKSSNSYIDIYEMDFFGSYDSSGVDVIPPQEVSDVNIEAAHDSAVINYTEPSDVDFSHANIYIDGEKYEGQNGSITINNLSPGTNYEITIKSVDTLGNESEGVTTTFTTDELTPPTSADEVPEVIDLAIDFDDERVDLSWENPPQFFEKAKIYRKDLGATETAFNWNPFAPMSVSANEDWQPLFETNGTEFSDLSIEPENEYEYKVTNNYDGMESNGVIISASVPKPPLVDTDEMELPFGVEALIKSGNGLLALIGGFVLLALAFIFVPKVIAAIRGANTSKGNASSVPGTGRAERIGKQPNVTDRQMNLAAGSGRGSREARQPRVRDRQVKGV